MDVKTAEEIIDEYIAYFKNDRWIKIKDIMFLCTPYKKGTYHIILSEKEYKKLRGIKK